MLRREPVVRLHGAVVSNERGVRFRIFSPPWWRLDLWVRWWLMPKRTRGTFDVRRNVVETYRAERIAERV